MEQSRAASAPSARTTARKAEGATVEHALQPVSPRLVGSKAVALGDVVTDALSAARDRWLRDRDRRALRLSLLDVLRRLDDPDDTSAGS